MSRHGYVDDEDEIGQFARWRGIIASATRGERGQRFFRELLAALDTMPEKKLITGDLVDADGCHCALGALGAAKGLDLGELMADWDLVPSAFDIAEQLTLEVMYRNDEADRHARPAGDRHFKLTPEERWRIVREWAARQIIVTPEELLPLP